MDMLEASGRLRMAALLRYHYGLQVDKLGEARRLRLFAELQWIKKEEQRHSEP